MVVAHPDDEALACGGTLASYDENPASEVVVCVMSGGVTARTRRPENGELRDDFERSLKTLGVERSELGPFPNIALNTVPHLELVQFIEQSVRALGPNVIITHHPSDINDDHRQTANACLAAARLFQRNADTPPLDALYFSEVLSATDWRFAGAGAPFEPDTYVALSDEALERKIEAIYAYRNVSRSVPHPRNAETVRALARVRGAESGCAHAEAFQTAFRRIVPGKSYHL